MVFELQAVEFSRYGGEIKCLSYLISDIHHSTLELSVYLRPLDDCNSKWIKNMYATKHLSE